MDLQEIRKEIDKIDTQIVELFEKRMELTEKVAEYKAKNGKQIFDRIREEQKINIVKEMVKTEFNKKAITELFTQIMSISRKLQYSFISRDSILSMFQIVEKLPIDKNTKVVYFGVPGTHTQQAMEEYFGEQVKAINALTFREVMQMVREKKADYGILPIENSSTGGIDDSYDLLVEFDNYIIGEHYLKIKQSLLGLEGAKIENLTTIYSHVQGLLQCSKFLEAHPNIKAIECNSTAEAAKKVAIEKNNKHAAIAGIKAAQCYGLNVLRETLNHESGNSTRFIIITNQPVYQKDANKVSICFTLPHESGTLYNMLSHFIFNNLNMTKIESRPISGKNWEYRFFVDFEGNLQDAGVRNAINGIKEESSSLRILGNFLTD